MNSSKLRGVSVVAGASAVLRTAGSSATPSAQQSIGSLGSHGAALLSRTALVAVPVAGAAAADEGAAGFNGPKRASIAPIRHSFRTCGGSPYSAPWKGSVSYTHLRAHETDSYLV